MKNVQEKIGYTFKNVNLLETALTHSSYANECKKENNENNFQDDKFKVGQIWDYQNRTGEENSKITILKVEKYYGKEIVIHIYVNGLKIKNELRANGVSDDIGHLPMSKESLDKSVTKLISENNKLPIKSNV